VPAGPSSQNGALTKRLDKPRYRAGPRNPRAVSARGGPTVRISLPPALFTAPAHRSGCTARCAGDRMSPRRRSEAEGLCVHLGAVVLHHRRRTLWAEQGRSAPPWRRLTKNSAMLGRVPHHMTSVAAANAPEVFAGVGEVARSFPSLGPHPPAPAIPTRWASRGGLWPRNRPSGGERLCSKLRCRGQRTGSIKCS
jgi:hypothetical protein